MDNYPGKERLEEKFRLLDKAGQLEESCSRTVVRVRDEDELPIVKAAIEEIREETGLNINSEAVKVVSGPIGGEKPPKIKGRNLADLEFRAVVGRIREVLKTIEKRREVPEVLNEMIATSRKSSRVPVPVRPGDMFRSVSPKTYRPLPGMEEIMPDTIPKALKLCDLFQMMSEQSQRPFYPSGKYSKEAQDFDDDPEEPKKTLGKLLNDKENFGGEKLPKKVIDALFLNRGKVILVEDIEAGSEFEEKRIELRLDEECFILEWAQSGEELKLRSVSLNFHRDKIDKYPAKSAVISLKGAKGGVLMSVYRDEKSFKNKASENRYIRPITNFSRLQVVKVVRR